MKFRDGLLLGALTGTIYGLLTAKKTGRQRQQAIAAYFNGIRFAKVSIKSARR